MAIDQVNPSGKAAGKSPSQVYNPSTGHYVKRDTEAGEFLSVKKDGSPFKGVRVEKVVAQPNPNFKKSTALKIEKAVVAVLNKNKK